MVSSITISTCLQLKTVELNSFIGEMSHLHFYIIVANLKSNYFYHFMKFANEVFVPAGKIMILSVGASCANTNIYYLPNILLSNINIFSAYVDLCSRNIFLFSGTRKLRNELWLNIISSVQFLFIWNIFTKSPPKTALRFII